MNLQQYYSNILTKNNFIRIQLQLIWVNAINRVFQLWDINSFRSIAEHLELVVKTIPYEWKDKNPEWVLKILFAELINQSALVSNGETQNGNWRSDIEILQNHMNYIIEFKVDAKKSKGWLKLAIEQARTYIDKFQWKPLTIMWVNLTNDNKIEWVHEIISK